MKREGTAHFPGPQESPRLRSNVLMAVFFPPGKAHLSHIVSEVFRFPTEEPVTFFFLFQILRYYQSLPVVDISQEMETEGKLAQGWGARLLRARD